MILSALAIIYLILRFCFTSWLDSLIPYSSYILELILVLVSFAITKPKFGLNGCFEKNRLRIYASLLVAGFLTYRGAGSLNIQIPFVLNSIETLIFLLIVAPILEECIFRFFLWKACKEINPKVIWVSTSVIFSYSHFHAFWFVPQSIHPFIIYQTAYTLILGLVCGYFIFKHRSLLSAILIHFFFNLGFYLSSL